MQITHTKFSNTPFLLSATLRGGSGRWRVDQILPFPGTLTVEEVRAELATMAQRFQAYTVRDMRTDTVRGVPVHSSRVASNEELLHHPTASGREDRLNKALQR